MPKNLFYFCTDVNLCQLIVLPKETEEQKKSNAKTGPYVIISHILTIGRRLVTVTSVVELDLAESRTSEEMDGTLPRIASFENT